MISFFDSCLSWLLPVAIIIFVHECGHYWVARFAGVSKENIRIRMLFFPQHVLLRNEDGAWIKPWQQPLYSQLCWNYFQGSRRKIILYVGAGLVIQSIFVWLGALLLLAMGWRAWAFSLFILSVQIIVIYFLAEVAFYSLRKKSFGDFTGLWLLSKSAFGVVCLAVIIFHVMAFLGFYFRP